MNLHFSLKKKQVDLRKHDRFNPHLFWRKLLIGWACALVLVFSYFTWFFMETSTALDAPVVPQTSENSVKIKSMQREVDSIEQIIQARTGTAKAPVLDPSNP